MADPSRHPNSLAAFLPTVRDFPEKQTNQKPQGCWRAGAQPANKLPSTRCEPYRARVVPHPDLTGSTAITTRAFTGSPSHREPPGSSPDLPSTSSVKHRRSSQLNNGQGRATENGKCEKAPAPTADTHAGLYSFLNCKRKHSKLRWK